MEALWRLLSWPQIGDASVVIGPDEPVELFPLELETKDARSVVLNPYE